MYIFFMFYLFASTSKKHVKKFSSKLMEATRSSSMLSGRAFMGLAKLPKANVILTLYLILKPHLVVYIRLK